MNIGCISDPGFSLRSNPGLKLANAFGVFKMHQYRLYLLSLASKAYLLICSRRTALVFEFAVEHHVGDFETHVQLYRLSKLRNEANIVDLRR